MYTALNLHLAQLTIINCNLGRRAVRIFDQYMGKVNYGVGLFGV